MCDFQVGDLIVYKDFYIDFLLKVDLVFEKGEYIVGFRGAKRTDMWFEGISAKDQVRLATKEEIKVWKRLP